MQPITPRALAKRSNFRRCSGSLICAAFWVVTPGVEQGVAQSAGGRSSDAWTIDPDPVLSIGLMDGPPEFLFAFVVVARILPDGNLVVGDRTSNDFRIFDQSGSFLRRFGGEGRGPAEFQYFDNLFVRGDTLIVHDPMNAKIARFDLSGVLISAVRSPRPMATLVGIDDGGALWFTWLAGLARGPIPRITADSLVAARFGIDGSLDVEFWAGNVLWRVDGRPYPFSPLARPAFLRGSILRVDALGSNLVLLDRKGVVWKSISIPSRRLDKGRAWSSLENALDRRSDPAMARRLRDMPREPQLPRLSSVLVDDEEFVWVKEYDTNQDVQWLGGWAGGEGGTWWVVDPSGQVRQSIKIPDGVFPLSIAGSRLVGRSVDELGVNRVVIHRIIGR